MADATSAVAPRSGFITALAWSFIILSGLATVVSLLQTIMITLMFPMEEMRAAMREAQKSQPLPAFFAVLFENFHLLFAAAFASSVVTLVASIGLLKRQNWARLVFIVLMAFGVVWNLAGLGMPFLMSDFLPDIPAHAQPEFQNFRLVWYVITGFTILTCLVFAGVFAWVVKRLMSDDIKREFHAVQEGGIT
jgi:hypothetical protein